MGVFGLFAFGRACGYKEDSTNFQQQKQLSHVIIDVTAAHYNLLVKVASGKWTTDRFWSALFQIYSGAETVEFVFDGDRSLAKKETQERRDAAAKKANRQASFLKRKMDKISNNKKKKTRRFKKYSRFYELRMAAAFRPSKSLAMRLVVSFDGIADKPSNWKAVVAEGEADIYISQHSHSNTIIVTTDSDLLVRSNTNTLLIPKTDDLNVPSWRVIEKAKVCLIVYTSYIYIYIYIYIFIYLFIKL